MPRACLRFALAALAVSLLAGAASGCAATESLRGFPPFLEMGAWNDDSTPDVVLRPFFGYRERPADFRGPYGHQDRTDVHYLFPFGHYRRRGDNVDHHLWPVFHWLARVDDEGFLSRDFVFFPVVWGGHDPVEGKYFSLWPLGGTLKGLLGKDLIVHALFPLFAYTRLHDYKVVHLFWPILGYWWGDGNDGFRVLPFFGYVKESDPDGSVRARRYTVLWPFFTWQYDNLNKSNPFSAWVLFPFYGQTRSRLVDETTILWPFFRKRDEKDMGIVRWRVPFPFVMLAFGNETQRDFWPLFGYRKNASFSRWFALWPIFRRETHLKQDGRYMDTRTWILPIFWAYDRTDLNAPGGGETIYHQRKIFPIIRWDRGTDGTFGVHFPSILWFSDSEHKNFETILTPFFEAFRYRDDPKHGKELRLLFNIFHAHWGADATELGAEAAESGWSLFGGLAGHRTTRDGDGLVRLLWFIEF